MSTRSKRHTPATPPPVPKPKGRVPTTPLRTSPRKLGTKGGGKGEQKKVSTKKVIRKTQKVKANLGGSKDNRSKKTPAPAPALDEVEEEDEENELLDDSDDDDMLGEGADDDDDDDADEYSKEDADDSVDAEDEDGEEDDSSDDEEIEITGHRRGTTTASFSQRKFRENIEKLKATEKKGQGGLAKKKPRSKMVEDPTDCQTARKSATQPESSGAVVDNFQLVHPYTANQSALLREVHVTSRIRSYVKNVMFRTIKFVNTDKMIARAMKTLFQFENVKEHKKVEFHMLYECVFNDALNTKRSACEQNGGTIVKKMLETMDPDELFTVEELCKLRRATTEREKQAFLWFFGTFLQSVCGAKVWGKLKFTSLVSKATLSNRGSGKKKGQIHNL